MNVFLQNLLGGGNIPPKDLLFGRIRPKMTRFEHILGQIGLRWGDLSLARQDPSCLARATNKFESVRAGRGAQ